MEAVYIGWQRIVNNVSWILQKKYSSRQSTWLNWKKIKRREDSGALGTEWIEVYYNFIKEVQSVGKKMAHLV